MHFIYQYKNWPHFTWNDKDLISMLGKVRNLQGKMIGKMEGLGFQLREEAVLETLTLDVLKSSEIEGERLNPGQVRSSIAKRLGIDAAGLPPSDRHVDGVVEMMLDATQHYRKPISAERLFGWHAALFPTGRSGMHKIDVGSWRRDKTGPMQVVSGPMGKERVHYQAPEARHLQQEMNTFIAWFNEERQIDPVIKAAVAHLWFVTIHPFDDGNGRIARAIADMQLARADESTQRFYSMSAQIRKVRNEYYNILESTQQGDLDITEWVDWFLNCLHDALYSTDKTLARVLDKARFWEKLSAMPLNERQKKIINKMLDGFDGHLTTSKWSKINKCSPDTALRDIQDLISKDILTKEQAGGRSTHYILVKV